jgi:predicted porin
MKNLNRSPATPSLSSFNLEPPHTMKPTSFRLSALTAATLLVGQLGLRTAAQAQTATLYGAIGLDLRYATGVADANGKGKSVLAVQDNAIVNSRIGIKGGEDLGGGLKAEFDLESSVGPDTGSTNSAAFWNRNAFVGLQGSFGTVRVGHQWNVADDYMCGYFVCAFYAPFLFSEFGSLSDYYDNTIKYTTPKFGGLEGGVSYTLGEVAGKSSKGQKFQAAANFSSGPLGLGAVIFSEKSKTLPGTNTMYALGASYDLGPAKLRLGLASAEIKIGGDDKGTLIDLGVDVPLSATTSVSADYVLKDMDKADDVSFLRLRGSYALSKRTSLNANFIMLDNSGTGTYGFVGSAEAGKGQTILTAGITHAF